MQNVNEIKRRVTGGQVAGQLARQPAGLALGEHEGMLWATNRYWITPAARVVPLLEQFNLSAGEPASFEVDGSVRKVSDEGFKPGRLFGKAEDYPEPLIPVRVGDYDALVLQGKRYVAAYRTEDGGVLGLPADDLAWLSDITGMQMVRPQAFELGPDERFGEVRVMGKGRPGSAPVAVVADVIRTVKHTAYGTDLATGDLVTNPGAAENTGPRIIGLLMSVKLEG